MFSKRKPRERNIALQYHTRFPGTQIDSGKSIFYPRVWWRASSSRNKKKYGNGNITEIVDLHISFIFLILFSTLRKQLRGNTRLVSSEEIEMSRSFILNTLEMGSCTIIWFSRTLSTIGKMRVYEYRNNS